MRRLASELSQLAICNGGFPKRSYDSSRVRPASDLLFMDLMSVLKNYYRSAVTLLQDLAVKGLAATQTVSSKCFHVSVVRSFFSQTQHGDTEITKGHRAHR